MNDQLAPTLFVIFGGAGDLTRIAPGCLGAGAHGDAHGHRQRRGDQGQRSVPAALGGDP